MPSTTSRTRFSTRSRVSGVRLRAVPRRCPVCGMMLSAVPAWNWVIETTADSSGSTLRDTIDCSALMIAAPTTHRVDRGVRPRRVAAETFDVDVDAVGRRHHRAGPDREIADREAGIVVHPVHLLDPEAVHHAVVDHLAAAAAALFGRLEDHHRGAVEVARLGEIFRGAEQHGGVAVVAAGVHLAGVLRLVGQAGGLLDRQRVHVGAQARWCGCRHPSCRG